MRIESRSIAMKMLQFQLICLLLVCFLLKFGCAITSNITEILKDRFNDNSSECLDPSDNSWKPAFQCSGIIIRGVRTGNKYGDKRFAWNKNPRENVSAFSFVFLRKDQLFSQFPKDYVAGFILYPHLRTPKVKKIFKALCAFPFDGASEKRYGTDGCGYTNYFPDTSRSCDSQDITTIEKWLSVYSYTVRNSELPLPLTIEQCGWDLTTENATRNFRLSMQAKTYIQNVRGLGGMDNNELRIAEWNPSEPGAIPIEAFFYLMESKTGQDTAIKYQTEYFHQTLQFVPVVGIRLPTNLTNPEVTFT